MLVLKRLSKALEDGDTIRAVIRGTSTNQDGRTPSITAPSATAQASLIQRTYQRAGLDFRDTGYFEAHGTGTAVGDPIEASGISQAFTAHRQHENPLNIGSVKANIGHLESSAGLAGLVKAVLVLEKGIIPPNALLKNLNPKILADKWHLNVSKFLDLKVITTS
jgi:acyl transferase domain-containing protein